MSGETYSIEECWRHFHTRLPMDIGEHDLAFLRHYINGYNLALLVRELPKDPDDPFQILYSEKFTNYVAAHFGESIGAIGWDTFLREKMGDDKLAIDLLFQRLNEFRNRRTSETA